MAFKKFKSNDLSISQLFHSNNTSQFVDGSDMVINNNKQTEIISETGLC